MVTASSRRAAAAAYHRDGVCVIRQVIPPDTIDAVLGDLQDLIDRESGRAWSHPHDPAVASWMGSHREAQSRVYRSIRERDSVHALARERGLVDLIGALLGSPFGVFDKIPVRIDTPLETSELAVWHQDHFYVRGNPDVVTAWIPLQDVGYADGCLQVMPGSHRRGPVPHPHEVLGKRHHPDGLEQHDIRLVPVSRGDVVLFHACLLHSGSLNLSRRIRFSLQPRYTRMDRPVNPDMGPVYSLQTTEDP